MSVENVEKAVVLLSGGIDSCTVLHYVKKDLGVAQVFALSFLYGQRHSREIEMARLQADAAGVDEHREIDISFFGRITAGASVLTDASAEMPSLDELDDEQRRQPPTYVPHRNLVLLSLAASYAESKGAAAVFYGAQAQDEYGYWDCTPEFVERLNAVLALNRRTAVRIHAPFAELPKHEVLKIGLALGVDYRHTWTCYYGGEAPCGRCPSCEERAAAFRKLDRNPG